MMKSPFCLSKSTFRVWSCARCCLFGEPLQRLGHRWRRYDAHLVRRRLLGEEWFGRIALRALSLGLAPSSGHFGISRGTLFSDFASWNSAHPYHWAQSLSDYLWWHSACTLRAMHVTIRTDKPKFLVCISPLISPLEKEGRQLTIFETVWNHQLYSVCHVNLWGYSIFT